MKPALSVVIPAFNEERRLPARLEEIARFLESRGRSGEIVVVDDGSSDGTSAVAERAAATRPWIRLIRLPANLGKGGAVRAGFLETRADVVLVTDADHSTPIEEIDKLMPVLQRGCAVVVGSRRPRVKKDEVEQPARRRLAGRVFNLVVSLAGLRGISDTQCGFKLFDRQAALPLFRALKTRGFAFDVEILLRARSRGLRIAEVGVCWRHDGDTRVRMIRDSARMVLEVLKMRGGR